MTLYTRLPICAHSPEEAHSTTHTCTANAHTVMQRLYMQSINRNKPTVTVFTKGNSNCAASVQSQPIMGLAVATEQCRPTVET